MQYSDEVAIIGVGKVGSNLARYFCKKNIAVSTLVDHSEENLNAIAEEIHAEQLYNDPRAIDSSVRRIFICVPDDQIAHVAKQLSQIKQKLENIFIAHTSGFRTSDELSPLAKFNAITGSFHPIQSFPNTSMDLLRLEGIGCGIEGNGRFSEIALQFAKSIDWHPICIHKDFKTLYHASCVLAGNFITTLAEEAQRIISLATGIHSPLQILLPMMESVITEMKNSSPSDSLTGPVARGDIKTIKDHFESLRKFAPHQMELYACLLHYTLRITELPEHSKDSFIRLIEEYSSL